MDVNESDIDYIIEEETLVKKTTDWVELGYGKAVIFLKDGTSKETHIEYNLIEKLKNSYKNVLILSKNLKGDVELYLNGELIAKKEKEKELEIFKNDSSFNIKDKFDNALKTGLIKF